MPYFPDLNCLFIHIPKNAGGSIECRLAEEDAAYRTFLRKRSTFPQKVRRWISKRNEIVQSEGHFLFGSALLGLSLQHFTLQEICSLNLLHGRKPNLVFAVIRNPYTRLRSLYFSHARNKRYPTFERFVDEWLLSDSKTHDEYTHKRPQVHFIQNSSSVDFPIELIHFEQLESELADLLKQIPAIQSNRPMSRRNAGKQKSSLQSLYSDTVLKKVRDYYAEDFETLGYGLQLPTEH